MQNPTKNIFVLFYNPGCGACSHFIPIWNNLSSKSPHENLLFAHVNVRNERHLARKYNVSSYPTLLFFDLNRKTIKYQGKRTVELLNIFLFENSNVSKILIRNQPESEDHFSQNSVSLNKDSFANFLAENPLKNLFVLFYSPTCGFCVRFFPIWKEFTSNFHDENILFAQVNAAEEHDLSNKYQIQGYPTLLFFNKNRSTVSYNQQRSIDSLEKFVKESIKKDQHVDQQNDEQLTDLTEKTFDNFFSTKADKNVFILFYSPGCGACRHFLPIWKNITANIKINGLIYAQVNAPEERNLSRKYQIKGYPTLLLFLNDSKSIIEYNGERTMNLIEIFLKEELFKNESKEKVKNDIFSDFSSELDQNNFNDFLKKNSNKSLLILFYNPGCRHCAQFFPTWKEFTTNFKDEQLLFGHINTVQAGELSSKYQIIGNPTIIFFKKDRTTIIFDQKRTIENLEIFVKESIKKDQLTDQSVSIPPELNEEAFDRFLKTNSDKNLFILFYSPGCGYCRLFLPVWKELTFTIKIENVLFAQVNAVEERNLSEKYHVTGYPTLLLLKTDRKSIVEYNGEREISKIEQFLKKETSKSSIVVQEKPKDERFSDFSTSLDQKTFDDFLKTNSNKNLFILFYSPGCGHCVHFFPTWKDFTTKFKDQRLLFAQVNAAEERILSQRYQIPGFPSILFFYKNRSTIRFQQPRSIENLEKFVKESINHDQTNYAILDEESFDHFLETKPNKNFFILFHSPSCQECIQFHPTWEDFSSTFSDSSIILAEVDGDNNRHLVNRFSIEEFPFLLFLDVKRNYFPFLSSKTKSNINLFLHYNLLPREGNSIILQNLTILDFFPNKSFFVLFYSAHCGHCKRFLPIWISFSEKFQNPSIKIAQIDVSKYRDVGREYEIQFVPTVLLIHKTDRIKFTGERSEEGLSMFVENFLSNQEEPKENASNQRALVESALITSNTFEYFMNKYDSDSVFVYFYSTKSPTCISFNEEWFSFSRNYVGNVVFAHIDGLLDKKIASKYKVYSFPTLILFKVDRNDKVVFEGRRTKEFLNEFLRINAELDLSELQNSDKSMFVVYGKKDSRYLLLSGIVRKYGNPIHLKKDIKFSIRSYSSPTLYEEWDQKSSFEDFVTKNLLSSVPRLSSETMQHILKEKFLVFVVSSLRQKYLIDNFRNLHNITDVTPFILRGVDNVLSFLNDVPPKNIQVAIYYPKKKLYKFYDEKSSFQTWFESEEDLVKASGKMLVVIVYGALVIVSVVYAIHYYGFFKKRKEKKSEKEPFIKSKKFATA